MIVSLLRWDGHDCSLPMKKGTEQITTVFESCYKWYVPHFHLAPEEAINTWWDEWNKAFRFRKGEAEKMCDAWLARAAKRLCELFHGVLGVRGILGFKKDEQGQPGLYHRRITPHSDVQFDAEHAGRLNHLQHWYAISDASSIAASATASAWTCECDRPALAGWR
ncbi:hypothetical protein PIB30_088283 [Stylosanthes scabra]|uniref:Uncharacterized protein n=1 Tax=Stylosanthes scabra TaxID=79078 RepID=A0ABU6ZSC4_9FABA|nr:hypothetical protein [Stylosanthes scabra]